MTGEVLKKKRLDVLLAERHSNLSRSVWQKHIISGRVSINSTIQRSPKYEVSETDTIAIDLPTEPDFSDHDLPILYLDDNIIVVDKPAGVLTHSKGALNDEFTVADFFRRYTTFGLDTNRPGIVHRLDRDTSGVIIGARNSQTASLLQKQFSLRRTKKTYIAIVDGTLQHTEADIELPIGRRASAPSTFKVDPHGKAATTHYDVLAAHNDLSLIRLRPITGRTHQLRVHLQYLHAPILGDRVYGTPGDRLYLHAYQLEITIPTGQRKLFTAPLPPEFSTKFPGVSP